jgi:hypothetical protein
MAEKRIPGNLTCSLIVFKGDDTVSRRQKLSCSETETLPFSLSQGSMVCSDYFSSYEKSNSFKDPWGTRRDRFYLHITPQTFKKGPVLAKSPWTSGCVPGRVQSNTDPIEALPQSNTFRQATRLDVLRQTAEAEGSEWAEISIRFNRTDRVLVEIHVPTLRLIISLPPFPLINADVFRSSEPLPMQVGQDMVS